MSGLSGDQRAWHEYQTACNEGKFEALRHMPIPLAIVTREEAISRVVSHARGRNRWDVIRRLLEEDCGKGSTSLASKACSLPYPQNLRNLQLVLDHGWDINERVGLTRESKLPLHCKSEVLKDEVLLKWFLQHGADPNICGAPVVERYHLGESFGYMCEPAPLRNAVLKHPPAIDTLVAYGARLDISSPLHWAVRSQSENEALLDHLLELGCDINALEYENNEEWRQHNNRSRGTPLHVAVDSYEPRTIKYLLSRGADHAIRNSEGETALEMIDIYAHLCLGVDDLREEMRQILTSTVDS